MSARRTSGTNIYDAFDQDTYPTNPMVSVLKARTATKQKKSVRRQDAGKGCADPTLLQ